MDKKQTKYDGIVRHVENLIEKGVLKPGDRVPSENRLSDEFGISRQTVRRAIGILEEKGVLRRVRGSGTYVNYDRRENLGQQGRIAVVTTYVDSYIFPRTIQGIESLLFERGYSVQISFTNNTLEREKNVLTDLISRDDVAGVIVEGTKSGLPNPNLQLYRKLINRRIPLLFYQYLLPGASMCPMCL